MARLIITGEHEAVKLANLHGQQVLQIDEALTEINAAGGYGRILGEVRNFVLEHVEAFGKLYGKRVGVKTEAKREAR